jgi:hypothetical protein
VNNWRLYLGNQAEKGNCALLAKIKITASQLENLISLKLKK